MKLKSLVIYRLVTFLLLFIFVGVIKYINDKYNTEFSIYDEYGFVMQQTGYYINGYKSDAAYTTNIFMNRVIIMLSLIYFYWLLCIKNDRLNYLYEKEKLKLINQDITWDTDIQSNPITHPYWQIFLTTFCYVICGYYLTLLLYNFGVKSSFDIFTFNCHRDNYIPVAINNITILGNNTITTPVYNINCVNVTEVIDGSFLLYDNIISKQKYTLLILVDLGTYFIMLMILCGKTNDLGCNRNCCFFSCFGACMSNYVKRDADITDNKNNTLSSSVVVIHDLPETKDELKELSLLAPSVIIEDKTEVNNDK